MTNFTNEDREKLTEVHTIMLRQDQVLNDHESRIRANEKQLHTIWAWAGAIGLFTSVLWDSLKDRFL